MEKRQVIRAAPEKFEVLQKCLNCCGVGDYEEVVILPRLPSAKPLKGFGSAGVLEVAEDSHGDVYRAIFTVRLADAIYVPHCFQKKSKHGIKTPKRDMDVIRERLKQAFAQSETQN